MDLCFSHEPVECDQCSTAIRARTAHGESDGATLCVTCAYRVWLAEEDYHNDLLMPPEDE